MLVFLPWVTFARMAFVAAVVSPPLTPVTPVKAKILEGLDDLLSGLSLKTHPDPPANDLGFQLHLLAEVHNLEECLLRCGLRRPFLP